MKNIIIVSNDTFFKKNFEEYVYENKLSYKLYFFNDVKVYEDINKIKKLSKKNLFTIVNVGLSGNIQYNVKNGPDIFDSCIDGKQVKKFILSASFSFDFQPKNPFVLYWLSVPIC